MNSNPKISIIVPVYNAEKTLAKCIESILGQKFRDFELLLVNDGSKDLSATICERYAEKDVRIKVFHQDNAGVSSARNLGLKNSTGEWLTFVDSDDYLDELFLNSFDLNAPVQLHLSGYIRKQNDCKQEIAFNGDEVVEKNVFFDVYTMHPFLGEPFAKLFKADMIDEYKLEFDRNMNFAEDAKFILEYLKLCKSLRIYKHAYYNYMLNPNGLSTLPLDYASDIYRFNMFKKLLAENELTGELLSKNMSYFTFRALVSIYKDTSARISSLKYLKDFMRIGYSETLSFYKRAKYRGRVIYVFTYLRWYRILDYYLLILYK